MNQNSTSLQAVARPVLNVRNLTAGYHRGAPVFKDLNLCISGPLAHLQGRNGSGKSTLIEVIAGILEPWIGSVELLGEHPTTQRARSLRCICRAEPALVPVLPVYLQVELISRGLGIPADWLRERLDSYGLEPWLDTPAGELSTGNLKKLWFVLGTAERRPLMILDEPFNGLDTGSVELLSREILQWTEQGSQVVVVAHELPGALQPDQLVQLPDAGTRATHGASRCSGTGRRATPDQTV
ncbi:ATP-binding cassette domain-containing protein [Glutamicibacter sp. MNS18]|uniref:ABC transporter ATP-binding protein n=1 Tax=Glutamicibacter sp. MNS18 TaxID=2989817 RepID=UPI00223698FA|nr:ATP-binding cassette domain-containing protein [Glutamicibacter sp. MNS18]MCW4465334.1 ATP-binding cassette domain-containing protein [Glutamicibacter sp. MNS18]